MWAHISCNDHRSLNYDDTNHDNLAVDIPGGDFSCPLCLGWIIEFGVYVFMEGGKPEGPRKKLLECGWEPTTCTNNANSTHCDARSRNWTWVTVVVGKPSHQCLWMRNYVTLRLGCAGLSIFSLVGIDFILFTSRHVLFICKMVLWKEPNFWNSVRKSHTPLSPSSHVTS